MHDLIMFRAMLNLEPERPIKLLQISARCTVRRTPNLIKQFVCLFWHLRGL
ncbi:MAG: hypothetical protein ACYDBJ_13905 [Aggregatilineales bacterium]